MDEKYVSWEELTDEQKEMAISNYQSIMWEEGCSYTEAQARKLTPLCRGFWVGLKDDYVTCNI